MAIKNLSITRETDIEILTSTDTAEQLIVKFDQKADVITFLSKTSFLDHRFRIKCDDVKQFQGVIDLMMGERLEKDATRKD